MPTNPLLSGAAPIRKRPAPAAGAPPIPVPLGVQKRTKSEPALVLCAEQPDEPPVTLLTNLAVEGGFKVEWTENAKKSVADRSLQLFLHNWDLRDVLDQSADYLDLICEIEGERVRFSTWAEMDGKAYCSRRKVNRLTLQSNYKR